MLRRPGDARAGLNLFGNRGLRHPFERRIREIKASTGPEPFDWYRFDSFANLTQIEKLIPGGVEALARLSRDEPVADIGAGDGDLAFLFESLGCDVTAIDWPGTNANQMRGIELLRRELGSNVAIREVDLDDQFRLDGERFGLVLALGLLYHLKNPFYFLERLAVHSRRAVIGTRVLPRGTTAQPIARLAGNREFENDPTNFWFFSEAGVERLLDRCGWDVAAKNITGDGADDRFFCLAESRIAKTRPTIRLLDGWHEMENNAWRWTKGQFAAVLENPAKAGQFEMRFRVVPELFAGSRCLGVEAEINSIPLDAAVYDSPGDHVYSRSIPARADRYVVRVRLSRAFEANGRELGVVIILPPRTIVDEDSGLRLIG